MQKSSLSEFVQKFNERHTEKEYGFENSIYVNSHTKMDVTCKKHGIFSIRPVDLLNGYGCPHCGGTRKSSTEEFVTKAKYVHNNFFSYERCNYVDSQSKVIVTCPIHGDFEVKANNHLNGANCKKCSKEKITHKITKLKKVNKSTRKLSTSDFIERCVEKYGDKYSYENTIYVRNNEKVIITCKEHGDFYISPNHFLSGRGCPICGGNRKKNTESFIKELRKVQPLSDYDFSKAKYVNIHTPLTLICNKCGCEFNNQPSNLLKYKQGCPRCKESKLEKEVRYILEKNGIKYEQYKRFDFLNRLSLDFYLPELKIAIECQGVQHFEPVEHFGGNEKFEILYKNDLLKNKLCKENNIRLLYYGNEPIPYFDEIITEESKLLKEIKYVKR